MKRLILICFLVIVLTSLISGIRINEIEMNPPGTDAGNEWVELYNQEEINLEGYKLINNDGGEITLSGNFSGYYVYVFTKQWLDNSDEKIFLYKNSELIDETDLFVDGGDNIKTWQLCGSWEFLEATKGEKNKCETKEEPLPEEPEEQQLPEEPEEEVVEINEEVIKDYVDTRSKEIPLTAEVISLTPKDIKSEDNTESLDKADYAKYGFIGFCILIGVLLVLKNKRKQKYEII